ncbi:unnamed protein product, partial [Ectocarpus fasciculatus]
VREVVREKFAEAGWDVRSNTATRDEPPTVDELHTFLEGTIEALESFDPPVEPTDEELEDPALACQRLWDLDTNRLTPEETFSVWTSTRSTCRAGRSLTTRGTTPATPSSTTSRTTSSRSPPTPPSSSSWTTTRRRSAPGKW